MLVVLLSQIVKCIIPAVLSWTREEIQLLKRREIFLVKPSGILVLNFFRY